MEICVDSVQSALNAIKGGASRLELCSCLEVGGLTPSLGLLRRVKELAAVTGVPVFALVRSSAADDFLYSPDDVRVMAEDIRVAKEDGGADGIVIGALSPDATVDVRTMKTLISAAGRLPVTFHRAIDVCRDPLQALDAVTALGCQRVLTSGQQPTAWEGRHCIRQMVEKAEENGIIIMPGGGISADNLRGLVKATGATEFHASCKDVHDSPMIHRDARMSIGARTTQICNADKVAALVRILATEQQC